LGPHQKGAALGKDPDGLRRSRRGDRSDRQRAPATTTSSTIEEPDETQRSDESQEWSKFTGQARQIYRESKAICGVAGAEQVARDLGIEANTGTGEGLAAIAEEWANGYQDVYSQPAYEGCLDAIAPTG
jgi:hypothetical protein